MSLTDKAMQAAIKLAPESWLPGGTPDRIIHKHGALGAPVTRVDGKLKVMGKARFAAEVPLPGLVYAALVHSTIARGRISGFDTRAAETAPGVVLVMTHENAPRMKQPPLFGTSPKAAAQINLPIMQDAEIHWNGQPVAVVLAETQEQADHAASLVRVTYESDPSVTSFAEAKRHARRPPSVMGEPPVVEIGNAEQALAESDIRIDRLYTTPRHNHNAIELHAVTVAWENGTLTMHDASQLISATHFTLAETFGLPADKVRVLSPYVGGGFGGKCFWFHQVLAAAAAKLADRPVRMVLSREGVYRVVGGRTCTEQRVAIGANKDGTLNALIHQGVAAMTTHNSCPEQFTFPTKHLYAAKSFSLAQSVADMDMLANTFMRAPGESIGTYALECTIDELAEAAGFDPIDLRRRLEPEQDPTSGTAFSSRHLLEAYATGAEKFGWAKRTPKPRARREGDWLIGMGVATATYPYYRMPGGSARIRLSADGNAVVQMAAQEMGMGTATAQAQHAAVRLGLPLDRVVFQYGDSDLPNGTVAGGSSQTATIGAAVMAATDKLIAELLKLAGNDSPVAGLRAEDVDLRDGGIAKRDDPARFESYASILSRAGRAEVVAEADGPPPLEVKKYSMHSTGAQFAEVRVNAITGEIRISRLLGSFDCGRILNAKLAASQFRGGIIMGIGLALMEETQFDERSGRIMNPSLAEYHVPVHMDVPEIEVIWTDKPDPHAPMGARGIGEIGITGVAAAIANAIYNATGKRIRDLPITLDKLL